MTQGQKSGILPDWVHETAAREKAGKIIYELNRATLTAEERERLETEIDDLLDNVLDTLADAPDFRQDKAIVLLSDAKKALGGTSTEQDLVTARRKVAQADQIAKRWVSEKIQARNVFWVGLVITLVAMSLIVIYLLTQEWNTGEAIIPLLGVPLSVVIWGGIGGVAAVIHSLMRPDQTSPGFRQVRILLVTRPVYGMIAGCVIYLLILSGLTAFAYTTQVTTGQDDANQALLWAMAFAGGFYAPFLDKLLFAVSNRGINRMEEKN